MCPTFSFVLPFVNDWAILLELGTNRNTQPKAVAALLIFEKFLAHSGTHFFRAEWVRCYLVAILGEGFIELAFLH